MFANVLSIMLFHGDLRYFEASHCNEKPAAGQWGSCITSPLCGKVLRPFQKLVKYLPYIVTPPHHLSQGSHRRISGCQKPYTGPTEQTLTSDACTTEEGKRKYQRLPSLFLPVSGLSALTFISAMVTH